MTHSPIGCSFKDFNPCVVITDVDWHLVNVRRRGRSLTHVLAWHILWTRSFCIGSILCCLSATGLRVFCQSVSDPAGEYGSNGAERTEKLATVKWQHGTRVSDYVFLRDAGAIERTRRRVFGQNGRHLTTCFSGLWLAIVLVHFEPYIYWNLANS